MNSENSSSLNVESLSNGDRDSGTSGSAELEDEFRDCEEANVMMGEMSLEQPEEQQPPQEEPPQTSASATPSPETVPQQTS
jgi:hypothetical protein